MFLFQKVFSCNNKHLKVKRPIITFKFLFYVAILADKSFFYINAVDCCFFHREGKGEESGTDTHKNLMENDVRERVRKQSEKVIIKINVKSISWTCQILLTS